jgi:hypothetical protein
MENENRRYKHDQERLRSRTRTHLENCVKKRFEIDRVRSWLLCKDPVVPEVGFRWQSQKRNELPEGDAQSVKSPVTHQQKPRTPNLDIEMLNLCTFQEMHNDCTVSEDRG